MCIEAIDPAVLHDDNPIGILHRGYPLGYDDLGGTGDLLPKGAPDPGICSRIHCTGAVIEDQYLGLL